MKKPTLKNIQISPVDIEQSFHESLHLLDRFKSMHLLSERDGFKTSGDVTQALGLSRTKQPKDYKVAQGKFERWVLKDRLPYAVACIIKLHEMGIMPANSNSHHEDPVKRLAHNEIEPFTYENELFPLMNILSSYGFWRGHGAPQQHSGCNLELRKNVLDEHLKALIEKLLSRSIKVAPSNKRICIDALRSRFLRILGSPFGRKTETPLAIPEQVILAFNTLEDSSSCDKEKTVARNIIKDFILTFFYVGKCKFSPPNHRGYYGVTTSSLSEEISQERVELFKKAIAISALNIEVDVIADSQIGGAGMDALTYYNLVLIRKFCENQIQELKSQFRERIFEMMKILDRK
jgi:hypothetical protein